MYKSCLLGIMVGISSVLLINSIVFMAISKDLSNVVEQQRNTIKELVNELNSINYDGEVNCHE